MKNYVWRQSDRATKHNAPFPRVQQHKKVEFAERLIL